MARRTKKAATAELAEKIVEGRNGSPTVEKIDSAKIKPLILKTAVFKIVGTSPYMQMRFSKKSAEKMRATHEAGQQAKSKKERSKRDFEQDYKDAMYRMSDKSYGIPASAFRNAIISACRTVQFRMTLAKLSIFCVADGEDALDGTPLVKLFGEPEMKIDPARNANGSMDLRSRPYWRKWHAFVRIQWDSDQFSSSDVLNLMLRIGTQVGVGEGRHDSRSSAGLGLGCFAVELTK